MSNEVRWVPRLLMLAVSVALALSAAEGCTKSKPHGSPAGEGGVSGAAGSGGAAGHPPPFCIVDFPCSGRTARCVGASQLLRYRDVGCSELCGARPCRGASCQPTGDIVDCPSGQVCRELASGGGMRSAQCVEQSDGGVCDEDQDAGAAGAASCPVPWGCGDGRVNASNETCDDGNRDDGDGCDRNCHREAGFDCSSGRCAGTRDRTARCT
jgi:cysteine-rich repeat protein